MGRQKSEPDGPSNAKEPFRPSAVAVGHFSLQSPLPSSGKGRRPCDPRLRCVPSPFRVGCSQSGSFRRGCCREEAYRGKHSRNKQEDGDLRELGESGMTVQRDAPRLHLIRRERDESVAQVAHLGQTKPSSFWYLTGRPKLPSFCSGFGFNRRGARVRHVNTRRVC